MWQIAKEEQLIEELEADAEEHPFEDGTDEEEPERKKLKRELRAEALARLEDSARTQREFENVIAWWNRLDANRERRERYHELSRSGDDVPLDYGASANELFSLIHGTMYWKSSSEREISLMPFSTVLTTFMNL